MIVPRPVAPALMPYFFISARMSFQCSARSLAIAARAAVVLGSAPYLSNQAFMSARCSACCARMSFTLTAPPSMLPSNPLAVAVAARVGVELVLERWVAAKATVAALRATTTAATPIQSILRLIILPCRCLAGGRPGRTVPS